MSQPQPDDAKLIADLNDLLQLDHDAVEGYTLAIDMVRDDRFREALVQHRADHKRHIEELGALVRARGGLATDLPHATMPVKFVMQAVGGAPNDRVLLLAFKAVERQVRDKYHRFAKKSFPDDVRQVVKRAADDEQRHYRWAESALRELGAGSGTLPHAVAAAVENVNKLFADSVEAAGRRVMEQVGSMVGTTRRRRGGAAPSPAAAAGGASDRAERGIPDLGEAGIGAHAAAFIAALREIERSGDLEPMVLLYDQRGETTGPNDTAPHAGRDGARHFWRMYRDSFERVESTFTNIVDAGDGTVMLEWTSHGRTRNGGSVRYAGASILEMRDGLIRRFRTYFNPRDLDVGVPREAHPAEQPGRGAPEADFGGL